MIDDIIFEQFPAGDSTDWSRGSARSEISRSIVAWREAVRGSISMAEVLKFTDQVSEARDPATIHKVLLQFAMQWTQARRVELILDGSPRRVLGRPEGPRPLGDDANLAGEPITLPLKLWGRNLGELRLNLGPGRGLTEPMRQQLLSLATMAITADRALRADLTAGFAPAREPIQKPLGPSFILPFLNQLTQIARRRQEPLAVFGIGLDRAEAIGQILGSETVAEAMRRVSRTIVGTLRSSDLVVQLDDRKFVAMLPEVPPHTASRIAETISRAVHKAHGPHKEMPGLGVSIGVAIFPDHAEQAESLLAAATEALRQAQSLGRDRVMTWSPSNIQSTPFDWNEQAAQVISNAV